MEDFLFAFFLADVLQMFLRRCVGGGRASAAWTLRAMAVIVIERT